MDKLVQPHADIEKHLFKIATSYGYVIAFPPTDAHPKSRFLVPVGRYGNTSERKSWAVLCEVDKDDHKIRQPISKDNCFAFETAAAVGSYGATSFNVSSWEDAIRGSDFAQIELDDVVTRQLFDFVYGLQYQERPAESVSESAWLYEFIGSHYLKIHIEPAPHPTCVVDAVCQICWMYDENTYHVPVYAGHTRYIASMLTDMSINHKPRKSLHVHPFHESLDSKEAGHPQMDFLDAAKFPTAAADALSRAYPRAPLRMETGNTSQTHPVYPEVSRHMTCIADMTRSRVFVVRYDGRDHHMASPTRGSRISHAIDSFLQTHADSQTPRANQVRQAMEQAQTELEKYVDPMGTIVLHEQRELSRHGNKIYRIAVVREPGQSAE